MEDGYEYARQQSGYDWFMGLCQGNLQKNTYPPYELRGTICLRDFASPMIASLGAI
jgi:hypothetical protein